MRTFRTAITFLGMCVLALTMTGCPNGTNLLTFDLYIINHTNGQTIGLVGLDNGQKELVDILDQNIPAGTMKKLKVSQVVYGAESGSVQIGVVNVGFDSVNGVKLGPDPAVILVEGDSQGINVSALEYNAN